MEVRPAERWADVAALFGSNGACEGCWCVFWHVRGKEYRRIAGDEARDRLRARVTEGPPPGLLAYRDGAAVGWRGRRSL